LKVGGEFLKRRHVIANPVVKKWSGVLINTHKLQYNIVWEKRRVNKKIGLIWLI
jgi:hypothetical protein